VEFAGEDITGLSPLELSRRGIGRTFQTLQVIGKLSVRDNLIVAAQEFKGTLPSRLFARPDAGLGEHADQMIDVPAETCRASAGTLSGSKADRHRDGVHAGPRLCCSATLRGNNPSLKSIVARAWRLITGRQLRVMS
jgi:hypothetical protein